MNEKRVLVFGAGWLGLKVLAYLNRRGVSVEMPDRLSGDIADGVKVAQTIELCKPDIVINAAGKTHVPPGTNIDSCEATEEARDATRRSNILGPRVLGNACARKGIYLVHLSSGCIFDGPSPSAGGWTEEDAPKPVSYYAETKVSGEREMEDANPLILRLRMPIDAERNKRNLITKLVGYPEVIDVLNSATVVPDLLEVMWGLVARGRTGIYHVTNPGPVRHQDILAWYRDIVDPTHRYSLVPPERMADLATTGRSNCILNTSKLSAAGLAMRPADEAIRECLRQYPKP